MSTSRLGPQASLSNLGQGTWGLDFPGHLRLKLRGQRYEGWIVSRETPRRRSPCSRARINADYIQSIGYALHALPVMTLAVGLIGLRWHGRAHLRGMQKLQARREMAFELAGVPRLLPDNSALVVDSGSKTCWENA